MIRTEAEAVLAQVKNHSGLIVLRAFDDCAPELFWLLEMTGPEFEHWWEEREEFWWAVTPATSEEDKILAKIFGEDPPPLRAAMNLPGKFLPGQFEQYGDDDLLSSLWKSFYESKRYYYCHLCCDGDSFLLTPDGRRIYHKGYRGRRF